MTDVSTKLARNSPDCKRGECPRCQARVDVLNAYADQVVALELEIDRVRADSDSYRTLALAALEQLSRLTAAHKRLQDAALTLREEVRFLRGGSEDVAA